MQERLLDVREVADRLGVSDVTIRRMIQDRELRAIRVRGKWKISEISLAEYMRNHSNMPEDQAPS